MPIYEFGGEDIRPLDRTTFEAAGMKERNDLQRLLRKNISVIAPDTLVIAEEFGDWDAARRRIDLLAIDRDANLVVIELKRTEDGGHMDLQAIRYAAMVSTLTFDHAVEAYAAYLETIGQSGMEARPKLLAFLGLEEPVEPKFAQDVRIVLAAADFSRELTTSVLWLRNYEIDIRCVRLRPYELDGRVLVDVQDIIPLPEAAEYQIRAAAKKREEREARTESKDRTTYRITFAEEEVAGLPKRHAIYQVIRHLIGKGIAPERIEADGGQPFSRAFVSVDGEVTAEEFVRLVKEAREGEGQRFDPTRYFSRDGELLYFNGRTYAFLNQWGGTHWMKAMQALRDKFPEQGIDFQVSE